MGSNQPHLNIVKVNKITQLLQRTVKAAKNIVPLNL